MPMRLYGGRILKNKFNQQIAKAQEMRDAVIMSVDSTNRYVLVKIQGSDVSIKAFYPQNWESTPVYLKLGNSVRINQPGGSQARVEIMGMGMLLPTAVPSGSVTPAPTTRTDTILTGCNIYVSNPTSLTVGVKAGTYQINEVVYSLTACTKTHDAASSTQYRYDILCVGIDGVVDIVKGTNFAAVGTIPDPPAVPTGHLMLGWVLIPPNCTAIISNYINRLYDAPTPKLIKITYSENPILFADSSTYMYLSIIDQYGNPVQNSNPGWTFTLTWVVNGVVRGDGTLTYGSNSSSASPFVVIFTGATAAQITFTKNTSSILFNITESETGFSTTALIQILDSSGGPIYLWTNE